MRNPTQEELRRAPRVRVCCRIDVRQPFGVWSAITEDLSTRGCRVMTSQIPRLGSRLPLRLSSDLFPEELYTTGEVVWVDGDQLGVLFLEEAKRNGVLSAADWVRRVMALGTADPFEPQKRAGPTPERVVPTVDRMDTRQRKAIPFRPRRHSG